MDIADIRKEYTQGQLDEKSVPESPRVLFQTWLNEYQETNPLEPTAMSLSTVDGEGQPWQRIVLLKGLDDTGFRFFTNYESHKGQQLAANPKASLHFFWPTMERQIQVQGQVQKVSREDSLAYFHSRPKASQVGAIASHQSQPLTDRHTLETRFFGLMEQYENQVVELPDHWGGFLLVPTRIEFWQGGSHRLHDRVEYQQSDSGWTIQRLNP